MTEHPKHLQRKASILTWLGIGAFVAIPIARWFIFDIDHQFANLAGGGLGLIGLLLVGLEALRLSSWRLRWMSMVVLLLLSIGAFCCLEFRGFTGETLPVFGLRSWLAPSAPMPSTQLPSNEAQLRRDASTARFSQFLGNSRDGVVNEPRFNVDWKSNPPQLLWKKSIGEGWAGFVVSNQLAFTLYQDDDQEVFAAFDLLTGAEVWKHAFLGRHYEPMGGAGPRSTPTIYGERIVVQTATGIVACLDTNSGKLHWEKNLLLMGFQNQVESESAIKWGRSASPLIIEHGEKQWVVVPLGGKSETARTLIALDLVDGREVWRNGTFQIAYSSPALHPIHGQDQLVSVNENAVSGHRVSDGATLWSADWPNNSNGDACAAQPVYLGNNRILLGKGYAQGSKVIEIERASDGKEAWSAKTVWENHRILKTKFTNSILYDDLLYALSDGILECVQPSDGKRIWRGGRFGQGQLLVVNGSLLILSEDGRIVLAERTKGTVEYEEAILEGVTWNYPAVAGPFLLIRNGTQMACLYCPQPALSENLLKEGL